MVERWYQCTPKPNSRHDILLDPLQKNVGICVSAYSPIRQLIGDVDEILQCWTNLPILQEGSCDKISDWIAINLVTWQSDKGSRFVSHAIKIDAKHLHKQLRQGESCKYGLTWRTMKRDKEEEIIRWLYRHGEDASIFFHPTQLTGVSWELTRSLKMIEHTVLQDDADCLILSAKLGERLKSTHLLDCTRSISAGATWERTKSTWHTSRSVTSFEEISDKFSASLIALKFDDIDRIVLIVPICNQSSTMKVMRQGDTLVAQVEGMKSFLEITSAILFAICPPRKFHATLSRCIQVALNREQLLLTYSSPLSGKANFGFCSWEALGAGREKPQLSKMVVILEEMERRAPGAINALLIDDGWQTNVEIEGSRRLADFDMDLAMLDITTDGNSNVKKLSILKLYIAELKHRFPSIRDYGVWMTLAGYWGGLKEDSFSIKYGPLYQLKLKNPFDSNATYTWFMPNSSRLDSYYNDYFVFLKESGISFIKVDDQAEWEWIQEISMKSSGVSIDPMAYYDKAWLSMTNAANTHFGPLSVINCMAFGNRCITGQILPSPQQNHIFRNSDDTFPNIPEAHVWHIYHNALNVCLSGSIPNLIPDADMITTHMPAQGGKEQIWADYHAAFRACFSRSTLWVSDDVKIKSSQGDRILQKLLSHSKDKLTDSSLGRLKTVQVGNSGGPHSSLPLSKSIFEDLSSDTCGPALKMSYKWHLDDGTIFSVILSVWNVRLAARSIDWITEADVVEALHLGEGEKESVFIFDCSSLSALLVTMSFQDLQSSILREILLLPLALEPAQYRIYSIISALAVQQFKNLKVACVGLIDKYAGLTAVMRSNLGHGKGAISSTLSRAGQCGFLLHGTIVSTAARWEAYIDGSMVQTDHTRTKQIDDCILYIIDMVSHLQSSCKFDQTTMHWQVDLQLSL